MATTKKKTVKKAPKKIAEKTTFMGLLRKGWEFDKKIFKSCWDFLKVGDVCSYVVGIMGLWLVYAAVAKMFMMYKLSQMGLM
tara:strand:- start:228 stop:473 length:246 start_codon:yes stop_codon:yes gene_type:complete